MARKSVFYLGRVIKFGEVDNQKVEEALLAPEIVQHGKFEYTFMNIQHQKDGGETRYIYADLVKYRSSGTVEIAEPKAHKTIPENVENLTEAISPFMYLPRFSGIGYTHTWNKLDKAVFETVFAKIINEKYEGFFAQTSIQPISDLKRFITRLMSLDRITKIKAQVRPTNPYYGPAWESLREYMRTRNLGELEIEEEAADASGVKTRLPKFAQETEGKEITPEIKARFIEDSLNGVADPAILMAVDGYGKGTIEGQDDGIDIVIRTSETQIQVRFDKSKPIDELYFLLAKTLSRVEEDRNLMH